MKVKMKEYFQGRNLPTLTPGQLADVSEVLGAWLVEHGKAELLPEPKPAPKPEPEPEPKPKSKRVKSKGIDRENARTLSGDNTK